MMRRTCARCLASASRRLDIVPIPCRVALRPISTSTPAFARSKPSAVVSSRIEGQYSQQDADRRNDSENASIDSELDENVRQLPEVLPLPNEQFISSWTVSYAIVIPLTTVHRRPGHHCQTSLDGLPAHSSTHASPAGSDPLCAERQGRVLKGPHGPGKVSHAADIDQSTC